MSFCHSVLPITNMLYYREEIMSFRYPIFTHIHCVISYRGNDVVLVLNFTYIHYVI